MSPADPRYNDAKKNSKEYTAKVASPIVNGDARLNIGDNSFTASASIDVAEVPFVTVNSIGLADNTVTVGTDEGDYIISRLGQWAQAFYDELCGAYNKAVLRAFFVSGAPVCAAKGDYSFTEKTSVNGKGPVHVYDNCVVALPPNSDARRIPLCFATGTEKGTYEFTLKLDVGSYKFLKLGYETASFADAVEKGIRGLHEKAVSALRDIDPSLTVSQASQLSKLMPEGVAAQIGKIASIAPSFVKALESNLSQTRAADGYKTFKEMCDPSKIWVGFKKNDSREEPADGESEVNKDPYIFWMIAPSPDGQFAAVEFGIANAATFVYRTKGDVISFATQLNRALEAIGFRREVIRLTDEELMKPENVDYHMASKRSASLQFIRKNFVTRIIHSSPEAWKRKLTETWNGK